jgi:predicted hotdog family 3-hydroxylacyl-ACP dehydratase
MLPSDVLPHGPGLRFISSAGTESSEGVIFDVTITDALSVIEADGTVVPEAGLEIMAQACGMMIAHHRPQEATCVRGVVAAVRGYQYDAKPFQRGDALIVRVKVDLVESSLVVCDAEISRGGGSVEQRARITLVLHDVRAEVV